jgi:hypothetical protein
MTVQERCVALRQRMSRGRERRQEHKGAEALRERATELLEIGEKLAPVVGRVVVLRRHEISLPALGESYKAIVALNEYREALGTEAAKTGRQYARLTKAIEKVIEARQVQISGALEALDRGSGSPDDSILSVLQEFPGKRAEAARIRAEWKAVPSGRRLLSASADELDSALTRRRNILVQIERLMGDINVGEMPDEVRNFFRALSELHSVPFERMTPSVQRWLEEKGLLKHVRVSFASG